jgi:molybdopterin synthase catalytic subunit
MHQSLHATTADAVSVFIIDGPLRSDAPARPAENAGALVCFEGIVRPVEDGRDIVALDYEAYQPMAQTQLRRLAEEMVSRHGLLGMRVEHGRGRIRAGEVSFRLTIASRHRPEALRATAEFIDRMKRDVPIWKTAVYPE